MLNPHIHGMPRRVRLVDWVLLIVIIIAVYTVLKYDSDLDSNRIDLQPEKPTWNKEDIREMCQFLEHEVTGQEGDQWVKVIEGENTGLENKGGRESIIAKPEDGNEYEKDLRLRGITLVFRHGERSPVSKVDDEVGCLPYRDSDRKAFAAYKELAESEELLAFLKLDPQLKQFPRVPLDAKCVSGMLTAEGAIQHVKLGKFFRHRYEKTKLFADGNSIIKNLQIHNLLFLENQRIVADVVSSKYNRTVQSALAFSSEFLYKQRSLMAPIQIKASNFSYHCVDNYCSCPIHKSIRKIYEEEHLNQFNEMKSEDVVEEEKKLLSFEQFSTSFDPFQMIDVGLGRFVCRRKTLPCRSEECVTLDSFNKMINLTTTRGGRMFDDRIGVSRRLQSIEAYPIITYLANSISKIRKFPHSNYIQIFSGHDVTVGPILRVLGIPFVDPPHYTSRIVFEIYEHTNEGLYIRVLYNGINRTLDVRFCQNDDLKYGMCKASAFEKFAKSGLFELAGVSEFKEMCYV
ncbi:Protein CBG06099 [Caenorhabditis briggsae]|uniref:Protein CBG06099 n=1 Tax=Caenorhabditis briggsae TaxID=6238 RepID=A8X0W8_CAEBR|nr:Protein CBG06099 [Caenorhabditis briggsae]CAP26278.2 Protein CBG06099 [Caenorhabditis briggsae]